MKSKVDFYKIIEVMRVKIKKIIVVYSNMFESLGAKEKMFYDLVDLFEKEDRKLRDIVQTDMQNKSKEARFMDGSVIILTNFSTVNQIHGFRCTHLYVEKGVLNIPDTNRIMNELLLPLVANNDKAYEKMDVEGSPANRTFIFGLENEELNIKNYKK